MNYYRPDDIYYTSTGPFPWRSSTSNFYACPWYPQYPNVPFPSHNAPFFCVNAHKKETKIGDNPVLKCDLDFGRPRTFLMNGKIGDDEFKDVELNVKTVFQDSSNVTFTIDFADASMKNKFSEIYIYFNISVIENDTKEIFLVIKYPEEPEIYLTTQEYPCKKITWISIPDSPSPASLEFTMIE